MDVNAITSLIGSLGFPIFVCIYMIMNNNKQQEESNILLTKLTDMVEQNTLVMNNLKSMILNCYTHEGENNE